MESRISGFYRWPLARRREALAQLLGRPVDDLAALDPEGLPLAQADQLIENVIGVLGLPVGLGLNLVVNGEDVLVPMAVEEPSVVAAFSHAAKMARAGGGFRAEADPPVMIGQVQVLCDSVASADAAVAALSAHLSDLEAAAHGATLRLARRGGGLVDLLIRRLEDPEGGPPVVVLQLGVDVREAMGANAVNSACEALAEPVEVITRCPVNLRILSNLSDRRLARASVRIPVEVVGGEAVALRIAEADRFARVDPYRAATHNKGLMNGVDAVALATGNDWRALEAGAHAYAARDGTYRGLTRWTVSQGSLHGQVALPMAVGTVGGATRSHPTVALLRSVLGAKDAQTLAGIFAAVGLAQNLGALRALAAEGIQSGHMALHARQLALAAGATVEEVPEVVARVVAEGAVTAAKVEAALLALRAQE